jgi:surface protein
MGTTADKLNKLLQTKAAIKNAIISKGVEVANDTKFADYPSKIAAISGSGSSEADTYYEDLFNQRTNDGKNMSYLFYYSPISEIDVSRIDTSKATSMSNMFYYCANLTELDLSNFNTSNVTNMSGMFNYCSKLTSLDLSNFNTSNVTNMSGMFYGCSKLTSLDLSNFNTSNVTNMSSMFSYCSNLTSLDLSNFDTSKVTSMSSMFYNCSNLQELRLDNCSNDTVSDIISSSSFPTGTISGVTRTIYCTKAAANGLTAPSGWVFNFLESPYYIEYTVNTSSTYALNGGSSSYKYGLPRIYSTSSSYTYDGYEDIEITLLDGTTTTDVTTTCNNVAKVKIWYPKTTVAVKFYGDYSYNPVIKTVDYCDTSNFTDMSYMFYYCQSLTSINLSDWNTSNVTNLKYTFCYCTKLTSLDVSNWNTSNVTSMYGTFWYCPKLTSLNLSKWNTSQVTTMYQMFAYCYDLAVLDLSNFDTSKVTSTIGMFTSCSKLQELRLDNCSNDAISDIITMLPTGTISGVTRTIYCTEDAASGLTAPTNWVFSFVGEDSGDEPEENTNPYYVEYTVDNTSVQALNTSNNGYCYGLPKATITTPGYGTVSQIIEGSSREITLKDGTITTDASTTCDKIAKVKLWYPEEIHALKFTGVYTNPPVIKTLEYCNTSNFTDMSQMFEECSKITELDLSSFDTSKVTDMSMMFKYCTALASLDVSNWDVSNVTNMSYMFYCCAALASLDLSSWDTSNVTTMTNMFYYCNNLTSIDVSSFNTSNVTDMQSLFLACYKLTTLDLSNFNTSNVTTMKNMFYECKSLTSLDLSNFNTSNVTDMYAMFYNCKSLTSLDLSNFDTSNVTDITNMFSGCTALTTITCNNAATINKIASKLPTRTADAPGTIITDCPESDLDITTLSSKGWNVELSAAEEEVSPYYVEYTVDNTSTYPLNGGPDRYYRCGMPKVAIQLESGTTSSSYSYTAIEITLLDGTTTTDITTPCSEVSKIKMWYSEDAVGVRFNGASEVKTVDYCNTSNFTDMSSMFKDCNKLTSIDASNWDISNVISIYYMFSGCTELTDFIAPKNISVAVSFSSCTKLTHDSLMSIINNLATVTSTITLTLGSTNLAKLTSAEKAIATNKGWTLA